MSQDRQNEDSAVVLLIGARAILTGADSVLSEIVYRHSSAIPEEVRADAQASYLECRRWAERIGLHLDAERHESH